MDFASITPDTRQTPGLSNKPSLSSVDLSSVSFADVRSIRQAFEQENQDLKGALTPNEHQALMVTMYESTEHFLNKTVSDFDIISHLELLKNTAQDLHTQGMRGIEFRNELERSSQDSLARIFRQT